MISQLQVDSAASYLAAFALPALDAIVPALPSETLLVALGVATAGSTDPRLVLLVACGALGAFAGDNLSYWLGRKFSPAIERRFFSRGKGKAQRAWAERSLRRFGMPLILVCRFVPGGRTAVTLSCGLIGYDRRKFVLATALAGTFWALYAFFAGRLGGRVFEDRPWIGLIASSALTLTVTGLITLARHLTARTRQDQDQPQDPPR